MVGTETLSEAALPAPGHALCFSHSAVSQEPGRRISPIPHPAGWARSGSRGVESCILDAGEAALSWLALSVSRYAHTQLLWSQVSHHPPSAAHHVFSKHGWSLWQEITIASKFRGKYISIMPLGELAQGSLTGGCLASERGLCPSESQL